MEFNSTNYILKGPYDDGKENPNTENLPNPRVFATHLPFSLL